MALPKQVRQQIEDANRIEGEMRAAQAAESSAPAEPASAAPTVVATPAAEPEAQAPAPAPQPAPQPDAQYAELLQQYRSLQGIHRTLARTNSDLQSQVQTLQASVQSLTGEVERQRQPQPKAQPVSSITDEEVKEFGPDLISVIERKAQEVAAPLNAQLAQAQDTLARLAARNAELEQSLNNVSQVQADTAQTTFVSRLTQLVPDFNVLNYDNNFLSWLSQVNPLDPRKHSLQDQLNDAVQLGDADAAAKFFLTFKSLVAQAQVAKPKPDLAAQAQPTSRAAPDVTPVATGKQWSQADISAFYDGVTRGRYSPAEKARIEKDIYAAQRENRIAA